jgi:general stress protein 26
MDMEEARTFMKEVGWGDLATSDGKVVGVRPMGALLWVEGELWTATGAASDKVKQLEMVPYAEYCFSNAQGRHLRIAGRCVISAGDADKKKMYGEVTGLAGHVEGPTTPDWVVIRMTPERVRMMKEDFGYEDIPPGVSAE